LAGAKDLLAALIFIAENTDSNQMELMRHSTVALAWCIRDKLEAALKDTAQLSC
jgi:hypothetical protein